MHKIGRTFATLLISSCVLLFTSCTLLSNTDSGESQSSSTSHTPSTSSALTSPSEKYETSGSADLETSTPEVERNTPTPSTTAVVVPTSTIDSLQTILSYTYTSREGYEYAVDYGSASVTVTTDTLDSLPGETDLTVSVSYTYRVSNLLDNKNAPALGALDLVPVWTPGSPACAYVEDEIWIDGTGAVGCAQKPVTSGVPAPPDARNDFTPLQVASARATREVILHVPDEDVEETLEALRSPDGWITHGHERTLTGQKSNDLTGYCHVKSQGQGEMGYGGIIFDSTIEFGCITTNTLSQPS